MSVFLILLYFILLVENLFASFFNGTRMNEVGEKKKEVKIVGGLFKGM